jgi:guanylate kinase
LTRIDGNALLVVLSSPSGGGKTSVIRRLLESGDPRYQHSVSATTRPRRPGETNGVDYRFVDDREFQTLIEQGGVVEYERVHDWWYGTPKEPLLRWLSEDKIILLDLDVKGAGSIRRHFPEQSLLIFVQPPSLEALQKRLIQQGTETEQQIDRRLQRTAMEMEWGKAFDFIVINDDLDRATNEVKGLIEARLGRAKE